MDKYNFLFSSSLKCVSNLVVILPSQQLDHVPSAHRSPYKAQRAQPTYTRDQLLRFKDKLKLDNWYSILKYKTITRVRELKINKRPRKKDTRKLERRIVNTKNLDLKQDQIPQIISK